MNKHEELVMKISEEMAANDWDRYYSPEPNEKWEEFKDQPQDIKDKWVIMTIDHARIAVKHMAQKEAMIKEAAQLLSFWLYHYDGDGSLEELVKDFLKKVNHPQGGGEGWEIKRKQRHIREMNSFR